MDFVSNNSLFVAVGCCFATWVFWELVFSPLRAFPGPFASRFTNIWRAIATTSGHIDRTNVEWHRQYGSAVRVGPNTISISDPNLIRTIYATKNAWPKVKLVSTCRHLSLGVLSNRAQPERDVQTERRFNKRHEDVQRLQYPRQCLARQVYEAD